jgi:ABC-2 type transport system permease protein
MMTFLRFEWNQWLRSPMTWIFLLIVSLLVFGAVVSDSIQIGGGVGSVYKNAPYVIESYYQMMSLICLLMTTAFMSATASREFSSGMEPFVFSAPISRAAYFFGKFIAAVFISMIPLLGVSIGALLAPLMPWVEAHRYGPVVLQAHIMGFLTFVVPNTFLAGAVVYGLAVIFRSTIVSFVGTMVMMVLYGISQGYTRNLEQEWLANILDPFGEQPFSIATKYWTTDERNMLAVPLEGDLLMNRLLWVGIGIVILAGTYLLFDTTARRRRVARRAANSPDPSTAHTQLPTRSFEAPSRPHSLLALLRLVRFEFKALVKNRPFITIVIIGLINLVTSSTTFTDAYGGTKYPVTYELVNQVSGAFYMFLVGIIAFYSGVIIWRERDARISEIIDATPISTGSIVASKLIAFILGVLVVLAATIPVSIAIQLANGFTDIDVTQYIVKLLIVDALGFTYLIVAALLIQALLNNRYLGYFAFVALLIVNFFVWMIADVGTLMVRFGRTPSFTFSDMNRWGPFVEGQIWFNLYWSSAALLLVAVIHAIWQRGREISIGIRVREASLRLRQRPLKYGLAILIFIGCGGWVFYNTQIINTYTTADDDEQIAIDYERKYKVHTGLPQPRWTDLDYAIELYPEERSLFYEVKGRIVNTEAIDINEIHTTIPITLDSMEITIDGARLTHRENRLRYRIYRLSRSLRPGDTINIKVRGRYVKRGFENEVSFTSVTQNGSFFNSMDILPFFGYDENRELSDKNDRIEHGLPPRRRKPRLDTMDVTARSRSYLPTNADNVNVTTVIGTSADQIAVAPGSLRGEWMRNGRRYFRYTLDAPSKNFYSFLSARYEVARERWNGIDLEVYHIPQHRYNVQTMLRAMRRSLEYYTQHFGPYPHRQARIIEFPRYASFAQAFPGTMPYSEGIGFISDLRNVKTEDIDFVFFVVAHEMAHQWWAHQLIGADMQGSEMLSESFAEYSALMVMEKEYGSHRMRKFLAYEMDKYLSGRSSEYEAERPIVATEGQGYIHYNKGSVVLYALKEMIGSTNVNAALRSLLAEYGHRGAPYPTSIHAIRELRRVTPDSLQYLIDDLFENITLFSNRVEDVRVTRSGAQYTVTVTTRSEKYRADSLGREKAVRLRDYMDVAVFGVGATRNEPGRPLAIRRVHVDAKHNTYTFTVQQRPGMVGIDPYNTLIDRMPDDNVKVVSFP